MVKVMFLLLWSMNAVSHALEEKHQLPDRIGQEVSQKD